MPAGCHTLPLFNPFVLAGEIGRRALPRVPVDRARPAAAAPSEPFEQLVECGNLLVGTPEKVGRRLLEPWDEFRFEELLIISDYGGTERWQSLEPQQLLPRDVMPMLREASASATR